MSRRLRLTYMGLSTDWQKMPYVLRDGESDVPARLNAAMRNTSTLMMEDDARLTDGGWEFILPRHEQGYLVR